MAHPDTRVTSRLVAVVALAALGHATPTPTPVVKGAAQKAQPNLMIILVDDLGFADLGYRENTDLKDATPFIDSIAAEGIKLDVHVYQILASCATLFFKMACSKIWI